jgi:hypothetical protein
VPESTSGSVAEVRAAEGVGEQPLGESPAGSPLDDVSCDAPDQPADQVPPPLGLLEHLPPLPADLGDAFDAFKLAIVHHRLTNWQEVSCEDVLAVLDALRQLALAPPDG